MAFGVRTLCINHGLANALFVRRFARCANEGLLMVQQRAEIDTGDLDSISAIWMFACNDSSPIVTYKGVAYRLGWGINAYEDVKKLVQSRGELFSTVIGKDWLDEWKKWVIDGKHWPAWVRDELADHATRVATVSAFQQADVFRCQLRTYSRRDTCTPEQIKLGLDHLDRLRKAAAESREERLKRWSGLVVPIAVPLMALGATTWIGLRSLDLTRATSAETNNVTREVNQAQTSIKRWELTEKVRGDAYAEALYTMRLAFDDAERRKEDDLQSNLERVRFDLYRIEPLVTSAVERDELWKDFLGLEALCKEVSTGEVQNSIANQRPASERFDDLRAKFHKRLYDVIFVKTPEEEKTLDEPRTHGAAK